MECAACVLSHFCQVYGYIDYMFVFSGRRGMHCWICDAQARKLGAQARKHFLSAFDIITVDNEYAIELKLDFVGWSKSEWVLKSIVTKFFEIMVDEQEWFNQQYIARTKAVIEKIK